MHKDRRLLPWWLVVLVGLGVNQVWAGEVTHRGLTSGERAAILKSVQTAIPLGRAPNSRYRVFSVESTVAKTADGWQRQAHTLLYDYNRNKTYHVVNDITAGAPGRVLSTEILATQVPPAAEEYAEAKDLVMALEVVQKLKRSPHVVLQDSFPVERGAPCDVDRCVEIQVNQLTPGERPKFLRLVTVDLSARKVVEVRTPRDPMKMREPSKLR